MDIWGRTQSFREQIGAKRDERLLFGLGQNGGHKTPLIKLHKQALDGGHDG
jgi:hypothetical protein